MADRRPRVRTGEARSLRTARALVSLIAVLAAASPSISADLVLVQRPVGSDIAPDGEPSHCAAGSRIVRVYADGTERVLTTGFDGACDPSVSFDGRHILFAGRRSVDDSWQIWRMTSNGGDPVQLTAHPGDATAPLWVGAVFHLDDQLPTPRFAYLATVSGGGVRALHTADLDGRNSHRITYTPGSDFAADVLPNGRLVYPTRSPDSRPDESPSLSVMGLNIDGTDLMAFLDPHNGPAFTHAVRVDNGRRLYFINSPSAALGGGDLGFVTLRRPLHSRKVLARSENGVFLDPAPLADGGLLASYRKKGSSAFEIVRIDPDDGAFGATVYRSEGYDCLDAQELAARPAVPGRSTVVDLERDTGVFFCISSHISDRPGLTDLEDRDIRTLQVIEARLDSGPTPGPPVEQLLGEAPIETDGSFHIEVPARTPLRFRLVDSAGKTVGEQRSWTWVMPREWRGCIGCHEDREMVVPNVLAKAVVEPAVILGGADAEPGGGD